VLNPQAQARSYRVAARLEPEAQSPQGSGSKPTFGTLTSEKEAQIFAESPPETAGIREEQEPERPRDAVNTIDRRTGHGAAPGCDPMSLARAAATSDSSRANSALSTALPKTVIP